MLALLLTAISAAAVLWCSARGYTLYYGDAEAHLNIARRVLDSRTPGPEQLGTVWLPLAASADASLRDARCLVAQRPGGRDSIGRGFRRGGRVSVRRRAPLVRFDCRRTGRGAAVRAQSQYVVSAIDADDRSDLRGGAGGAAVGDAVVPRFAIGLGGAGGRGGVERGVAHALRRLVPDSVRRAVLSDHRAPEIARAGLRGAGRAGAAGVAGAQSVLLFERAGVL